MRSAILRKNLNIQSMKKAILSTATGAAALALALTAAQSCDFKMGKDESEGMLRIHFVEDARLPVAEPWQMDTKAGAAADTNEFILSVTDSKGASLYYGKFGAAPETIVTAPGTYTVSAKSCEFTTPLFAYPQYGDTQVVVVKSGEVCSVTLDCSQINSGIRLKIDPEFLVEYPKGVLFLKSADGRLMYGYTEKRIAYFRPGNVSLVLNNDGKESVICSRNLEAREVLTLYLSVASSGSSSAAGIHVQVDTSRNWTSENLIIGDSGSGKGKEMENAFSVSQAKDNVGEVDVWITGYIVGGDLSSSRCSFTPPFSSRTNIAIADKASCTDKASCMSVQLASGAIRDALNLVDNPGLLGTQVWIKGDIVAAYYGIPGIQSISEYSL